MVEGELQILVDEHIAGEISVDAVDPSGNNIGEGFGHLIGDTFDLHSIRVLPRLSRGGIGTAIFEALVASAKDKGAQKLTGHFDPDHGRESQARAFYTKMGVAIDSKSELLKVL